MADQRIKTPYAGPDYVPAGTPVIKLRSAERFGVQPGILGPYSIQAGTYWMQATADVRSWIYPLENTDYNRAADDVFIIFRGWAPVTFDEDVVIELQSLDGQTDGDLNFIPIKTLEE